MKKIIIIIFSICMFAGWSESKTISYTDVKEQNVVKNSYAVSKNVPKYFIAIKIHQKTFTLDIMEHIKNHMNDITIWVETSESYYKSVKVGQELSGKFKSGSFWIDGDISHLHISIADKQIK